MEVEVIISDGSLVVVDVTLEDSDGSHGVISRRVFDVVNMVVVRDRVDVPGGDEVDVDTVVVFDAAVLVVPMPNFNLS